MSKNKMTRKIFLQIGLWFSGLVSSWGIFRFLSYETPKTEVLSMITLSEPNHYLIGSVTYIPQLNAYLVHDKTGYFAVSARCTHLGCTVREEDGAFVCPCHGSKFSISSQVINGPAIKALPHFELSLSEGGQLVIDRRIIVPANQKLNP